MNIRRKITEAAVCLTLTVCLAVGGFFVLPAQKAVSAPAQPDSSQTESSETISANSSSEALSSSSEESSSQTSSTGRDTSQKSTSSKQASSSTAKLPSSKPPVSSKPSVQVPAVTAPSGNYVVGYYASWARGSGLPPENLDASLLTHIHYAFANLSASGDLILPYPNTDKKNFEGLNALKRKKPGLKTFPCCFC